MDDARPRAFAESTIAGSRRHMVASVVVCGAVEAFQIAAHEGPWVHAGVAAMLAFLLGYNVLRMRRARRALAAGTPAALRAFVDGQTRSHVVRGRIFLFACPLIVIAGWVSGGLALGATDKPALYLTVMVATTGFLAWGWVRWWRTLRRIAQEHT